MANKSIHLRIPEELHNKFLELKEEHGYTNIQEFIKEAMRVALKDKKENKLEEVKGTNFDPY